MIARRKNEKTITHREMLKRLKVLSYEEGHRRKPESIEEVKALEKLSAEAFPEEGW